MSKINEEDQILRDIIQSSPSYIDYEYELPIICDSNFQWYSAKQWKEHEEKINANEPKTEQKLL